MINSVFREYLDDILVYLDTLKEYKKHVYLVLKKTGKGQSFNKRGKEQILYIGSGFP